MHRIVHRKIQEQLYFVSKSTPLRSLPCRSLFFFETISQNNFIPLFRDSRLQHMGGGKNKKEKKTLSGIFTSMISKFIYVTIVFRGDRNPPKSPQFGKEILIFFPFNQKSCSERKAFFCRELPNVLGSTNPCPNTVHTEPFSTSVFKVLT